MESREVEIEEMEAKIPFQERKTRNEEAEMEKMEVEMRDREAEMDFEWFSTSNDAPKKAPQDERGQFTYFPPLERRVRPAFQRVVAKVRCHKDI